MEIMKIGECFFFLNCVSQEKEKPSSSGGACALPPGGAAVAADSAPAPNESAFTIAESTPAGHRYKLSLFQPHDPKNFIKFVRKEVNLLKTSLPTGIFVKAFEDRMVREMNGTLNNILSKIDVFNYLQ